MKILGEEYARLPGRSRPAFGITGRTSYRLYVSDKNLLLLDYGEYSEKHRRIALQDIQALTLTPTNIGVVMNVLVSLLLAITGFFFVTYIADEFFLNENPAPFAGFFWGGSSLLLFMMLAFNIARGPTCRCNLRTAVDTYDLPSLRRRRPARRALEQLAAAAESVQGRVPVAGGAPGEAEPQDAPATYTASESESSPHTESNAEESPRRESELSDFPESR